MKVEISDVTKRIISNYAQLNPSIRFEEGNVLRSLSLSEAVYSKAKIDVSFPRKFFIYDLNEFLAVINMFSSPVLDFSSDEDFVLITDKDGKDHTRYIFAAERVIKILPPEGEDYHQDHTDLEFKIKQEDIKKMLKLSNILDAEDFKIVPINGDIVGVVCNKNASESSSYSINLGKYDGEEDFEIYLKLDHLNIIPDDYSVLFDLTSVNQNSRFVADKHDVEYFISLETDSRYGV